MKRSWGCGKPQGGRIWQQIPQCCIHHGRSIFLCPWAAGWLVSFKSQSRRTAFPTGLPVWRKAVQQPSFILNPSKLVLGLCCFWLKYAGSSRHAAYKVDPVCGEVKNKVKGIVGSPVACVKDQFNSWISSGRSMEEPVTSVRLNCSKILPISGSLSFTLSVVQGLCPWILAFPRLSFSFRRTTCRQRVCSWDLFPVNGNTLGGLFQISCCSKDILPPLGVLQLWQGELRPGGAAYSENLGWESQAGKSDRLCRSSSASGGSPVKDFSFVVWFWAWQAASCQASLWG